MVRNAQAASGLYGGDPIRPGFFLSFLRCTGTSTRRKVLIVTVVLVSVAALIVISLALFFSLSRQSQSYKDGYSVGGAVYAADASAQLGAQQACKATELRGPHHGGLPVGANATQWMKGCVAAFALAQGDN
jgi:hypothetical protein